MRAGGPLVAILLLYAAGLCAAGQFAKIAVPFPEVRALHPGAPVGWLLSSVSLVGAMLGVVAGDLVGRLRAARTLHAGMALGAATSLWQGAEPAFAPFLASRVIEGLAHVGIVVAAPTLIAQIASERWQGAAMALWSTFFGTAFAVTAWLGLPLAASHGPGALMAAHGALTAAVGLLLGLVLPLKGPTRAAPRLARAHRRAWGSAFVAAPAAGWLFYTCTYVALLAVMPAFLPTEARAAATLILPLAGIAASLALVAPLVRRFGAAAVVMSGFGLATSVLAALALEAPPLVSMVALFTVLGLVQGASFAMVPQLNPGSAERALSYGALAQAGNLGNLVGTPLLLAVLAIGGTQGALLLLGALYLAGIGVHLALAARRAAA